MLLIVEIYIYRYIQREKNKLYKDLRILEAGKDEVAPLGGKDEKSNTEEESDLFYTEGTKNILNSSFALNGSLNKKGLIPFH